MNQIIQKRLQEFARRFKEMDSVGLGVARELTQCWQQQGLPIKPSGSKRPKHSGTRKSPEAIRLLTHHEVPAYISTNYKLRAVVIRRLARDYEGLILRLQEDGLIGDLTTLAEIEEWWAERIQACLDQRGLEVHLESNQPASTFVTNVLNEALLNQVQFPESRACETALLHMIGAILSLSFPEQSAELSESTGATVRSGVTWDFKVNDCTIHVIEIPSIDVIRDCVAELARKYRPTVLCLSDTKAAAAYYSKQLKIHRRIDIFSAEEFISLNLNKQAGFSSAKLHEKTLEFIKIYNESLSRTAKPSPSLRIKLTAGPIAH